MNEKELTEKMAILRKAIQKQEPAATIAGLLKDLHKAGAPSEHTLRVRLRLS